MIEEFVKSYCPVCDRNVLRFKSHLYNHWLKLGQEFTYADFLRWIFQTPLECIVEGFKLIDEEVSIGSITVDDDASLIGKEKKHLS